MRSPLDRLRLAISFEVIGLLLIIPLGALVFHKPPQDIGVIGIVGSVVATIWNMGYNLMFDLWLRRRHGTTLKTPAQRVVHALLFEAGLLALLLPFIAWYLGVTVWEALVLDLALAGFFVVYALVFNWAYDRVFPLPEWRREA